MNRLNALLGKVFSEIPCNLTVVCLNAPYKQLRYLLPVLLKLQQHLLSCHFFKRCGGIHEWYLFEVVDGSDDANGERIEENLSGLGTSFFAKLLLASKKFDDSFGIEL